MSPGPIRRRRSKLLLDASPYADIVALSPDYTLILDYAETSADGQLLYTDSGASVPVTSIGDPIGSAKWGGGIAAAAAADAERPTWLGQGTGADFDGSDDMLSQARTQVNNDRTVVVRMRADVAQQQQTVCTRESGDGWQVRLEADGSITCAHVGVDAISTPASTYTAGSEIVVVWTQSSSAGGDIRVDGSSVATDATFTADATTESTQKIYIGQQGSGAVPLDGKIREAFIFDRALNGSEISTVESTLGV